MTLSNAKGVRAREEDACCFGFGYNGVRGSRANDERNAGIEGEVLRVHAIDPHTDLQNLC